MKAGEVEVYNENFFKSLDDVELQWTLESEGKVLANGRNALDIPAQQKRVVKLDGYSLPADVKGEVVLNLDFVLKKAEPMLDAGYAVAREQFVVNPYTSPRWKAYWLSLPANMTPGKWKKKKRWHGSHCRQETLLSLSTIGTVGLTTLTWTGNRCWKSYAITPDFWRAPTDNDYGAGTQRKLHAWKNPEMKMKSFKVVENEARPRRASKWYMTCRR